MDDQELMQAALSDEAPVSDLEALEGLSGTKLEHEALQEQPRDEHGRFAPKAEQVEAQPVEQPAAEQPKPDAEAQVPSWRLRELREEREAAARRATEAEERAQRLEAQMRQLQARAEPPKPAPDMYAEPEAWQQHLTQQTQSAILQAKLDLSEDWARDKFGDEKVDTAIKWAEQNLSMPERMRLAQNRNPSRELVKMYDERQALTQIGGDLNAYRQKVMDEALNDPTFMQKVADKLRGTVQTTNGQRPVVQLPPSLNKATGSNVGHDAGGSMSDADLYASAIR